jgi:hypothetical protein
MGEYSDIFTQVYAMGVHDHMARLLFGKEVWFKHHDDAHIIAK